MKAASSQIKMNQKKVPQKKKTATKGPQNRRSYAGWFPAGIIVVFVFLLYGNTLNHGYSLDDDIVSKGNVYVQQGFKGIPTIFSKGFLYGFNQRNDQSYRPISLLTLAVEVEIWKENPGTHHLFNVLWYAVSCILLFFLLKRLFPKFPLIIPLVMTLLFAAHPIHTETIANIKSRDEILNFLFLQGLLLSLFSYIDTRKKTNLLLSLFFFFLALLTKEQSVAFFLLVPLFLWFFSEVPWKRIFFILLPYGGIFIFYMVLRWLVLDTVTFADKMTIINNALVAATNPYDRLATAILILGRYFLLLWFPHPLSFDYSYNQIPIASFTDGGVILTLAVFAAWGIYAIWRFRNKEVHSFSFFFFFITMAVISNIFILIGSVLGERFLHTPSMAFCMSLVILLAQVTRSDLTQRVMKKNSLFLSLAGVILVLYSVKTVTRNRDWKDNLSLFESGVKASPNSTRTWSSLGFEYMNLTQSLPDPANKRNYYNKAKECFERSIAIMPENTYALYNYGVLEYAFNRLPEAEELYRRTVTVDANHYDSWNNLSAIAVQMEKHDSAIVYFNKLLTFRPNDPDIIGNIGVMYQRKKEYAKAIQYHEKALSINPYNTFPISNLLVIYSVLGDTAKVRYYTELKNR